MNQNVKIPTAICTLFEGNYHYGLGALTNSLYRYGFRGTIWAGFKGDLPFWAKPLNKKENYLVYEVAAQCRIHFIPLDTDFHLTNYKPLFMLDLWDTYGDSIDGLCYFDPDIVVKCEWSFFENWLDNHVALCEDINSPLNASAPKRLSWQKVLKKHQIKLPLNIDQYVNGGFVGLKRANRPFLESWKKIMDIIGIETESLTISSLPSSVGTQTKRPPTALFYATDQDGLNCAAMLHEEVLSIANQDAMDFGRFGTIMSHALGGFKPWKMNYIKGALSGRRAGIAQKLYWQHVMEPIPLYSKAKVKRMQFWIKLASFISNFYSR